MKKHKTNDQMLKEMAETQFVNNPARAGELVAQKVLFGQFNRYSIAPVHNRFADEGVVFFVWDAEYIDTSTNAPEVIRQAKTVGMALYGLK
jgi:hypothetical protein